MPRGTASVTWPRTLAPILLGESAHHIGCWRSLRPKFLLWKMNKQKTQNDPSCLSLNTEDPITPNCHSYLQVLCSLGHRRILQFDWCQPQLKEWHKDYALCLLRTPKYCISLSPYLYIHPGKRLSSLKLVWKHWKRWPCPQMCRHQHKATRNTKKKSWHHKRSTIIFQ